MSQYSPYTKRYIIFGILISLLWLTSILFLLDLDFRLLSIMTPSEIGNVMYVLSAPLVFLWLAIGYLRLMDDYQQVKKELTVVRQMFLDLKQRLDKISD
ncbi:hypothetical protein BegalDRAFT_1733 [Beggiatoa alba B18LD]|uniref:Uncharacterized protein n=1 Tax=Beggiatoa alba B18LD TaxID=395493 RepID=I3CG67_9GAMM|nr:hypothetical protein [Beggiatoa alba]EIJ42610.1 hypothetical protein BegalDRAFT_1733 [Beggiatoa alba B18LD]